MPQFDDVWPVLTLILGYAGSQYAERRREGHERKQIILQRAADVEGEALLELQDLLIELPDKWLDYESDVGTRKREHGALEFEAAYEEAAGLGRTWQRATLLASRIMDDGLRAQVRETIQLAYPWNLHVVTDVLHDPDGDFDDYPYELAEEAVARAVEAIGDRLRHAATALRT